MKLKLFDRNNTLLWERDIDKSMRTTIIRVTQPEYTNISCLAQTLTPVQTNTLKDACISLLSPWVAGAIYHKLSSDYRWNTAMVCSVIKMGTLDTLTIPIRAITWLPRSVYNMHEHPFKTWLRQQDAPFACLHQSRMIVLIEGDVKFSRLYKVKEDDGHFQVHLRHHRVVRSFPVNLTATHWYYNVGRFDFKKSRKTVPDSSNVFTSTYPEIQQFISNDIKNRDEARTTEGKPSFSSKNKRYNTLMYFRRPEPESDENDSVDSDSSTNGLISAKR